MPRRLGDSPLARAKAAAAAEASRTKSSAASSATSNDVFFQRRGATEETPAVAANQTTEAPEITEISQIPEIRETTAAPAPAPAVVQPSAPVEAPPVQAPAPTSFIEEVVARAAAATPRVKEPEPINIPKARDIEIQAGETGFQDDGGFLKRLLDKLRM